jgi:hypothetical protein
MSITFDSINTRIAREVNPSIELVRGDGYQYFVYDDPHANVFETESVMVSALSHLTGAQWIEAATTFHQKVCQMVRDAAVAQSSTIRIVALPEAGDENWSPFRAGDVIQRTSPEGPAQHIKAPEAPAAAQPFEVALYETRERHHRLIAQFDLASDAAEAARGLSRLGRDGALITMLDTRRGERTVFWYHNGRRLDLAEAVQAGLMYAADRRWNHA